ncbi:unnamed protein product, partial [Tetraodon nigroviridis]
LGWVKRASWLEAVMAGPGRPRGRLPTNWVQRLPAQQTLASGDPVKIPKKRGPKPGSKSPFLRRQAPQSLTPALCLWTTPLSPSLHYRPQQVHNSLPALAYVVHVYSSSMHKCGHPFFSLPM